VLHRDVKPSNVLIGEDGRFVLSDFGLARILQAGSSLHATVAGMVAGTPAYMAPEQALGEPADARTDLYGLAILLYEIVTGRVPFRAETPLATMLAHVHQPVPDPRTRRPETDPAVAGVLLRALAKAPDDRYQSGVELALALRDAIAAAYGEGEVATGTFVLPTPAPAQRAEDASTTEASSAGPRRWLRFGAQPEPDGVGAADESAAGTGAVPLDGAPSRARASPEPAPAAAHAASPRRRSTWVVPARLAAAAAAAVFGFGVATAGWTLTIGPGRPALSRLVAWLGTDVPPQVEVVIPHNNRQQPTLRPSFTIAFTAKMDQETVEHAVRLDPAVPLDFEWTERFLVVQPRFDLEPDTLYTLIIDQSAMDIEGRVLTRGFSQQYRSVAASPANRGATLAIPVPGTPTPPPAPALSLVEAPAAAVEQATAEPSPTARPRLAPSPTAPSAATAVPPTAPASGGVLAPSAAGSSPAPAESSNGAPIPAATPAQATPAQATPAQATPAGTPAVAPPAPTAPASAGASVSSPSTASANTSATPAGPAAGTQPATPAGQPPTGTPPVERTPTVFHFPSPTPIRTATPAAATSSTQAGAQPTPGGPSATLAPAGGATPTATN
jgi:hypothetical protein